MGGGDGDWDVVLSPPLAEVTLALVGKIGTGKSATANCILGTPAFASERSYVSVTETCQRSSAAFHDGCGATRTVNVIDTPGLFDMDISTEDARKEVVKCIEMSKDGIHAMLMVFSAASRFSREEHDALESIKLFFGDKILDHIILVFTHGDEVGDEVAWKKMLTVKSPVYLQEMVKLCQNRVVLFDNKTNGVEHREMQRRKLLAAVDLVISSNGGKAFTYQMLPQIQADEKLNSKEEQIRRLTERLDKFQKEHDSVKREVTNAEKLRRLDEEKMISQKKEINSLRKEVDKARLDEMVQKEKEIQRLMEKLDLANKEKDNYKAMYDNKCIVM